MRFNFLPAVLRGVEGGRVSASALLSVVSFLPEDALASTPAILMHDGGAGAGPAFHMVGAGFDSCGVTLPPVQVRRARSSDTWTMCPVVPTWSRACAQRAWICMRFVRAWLVWAWFTSPSNKCAVQFNMSKLPCSLLGDRS